MLYFPQNQMMQKWNKNFRQISCFSLQIHLVSFPVCFLSYEAELLRWLQEFSLWEAPARTGNVGEEPGPDIYSLSCPLLNSGYVPLLKVTTLMSSPPLDSGRAHSSFYILENSPFPVPFQTQGWSLNLRCFIPHALLSLCFPLILSKSL